MKTLHRWLGSALLLIAALVAAAPLAAQEAGTVGTIVVAHGGDEEWNAKVIETARQAETGGPVEVSFLMGDAARTHRFQDAAERLVAAGAREIVVVPLLVSSHSGHADQIRYLVGETDSLSQVMRHHLHMAGIERPSVDVPIHWAPALDDAPEMAEALAERALALAEAPAEQALFLIGHGPNGAEDYAAWMENLRPVADRVKEQAGFGWVRIGLVRDDASGEIRAEAVRDIRETIQLLHEVSGRDVVVVPILISTGAVNYVKFPRDLDGLPVVYEGSALLPHPALARWIEGRVRQAVQVAAVPPSD